jgi:hypothetical protein
MTYTEIVDEINAFGRRRQAEYKERAQFRALMDYQLAQLIGVAFNDPKKYPKSLKQAYPELFDAPDDWRAQKASFKQFAEEFNRQRGEKNK